MMFSLSNCTPKMIAYLPALAVFSLLSLLLLTASSPSVASPPLPTPKISMVTFTPAHELSVTKVFKTQTPQHTATQIASPTQTQTPTPTPLVATAHTHTAYPATPLAFPTTSYNFSVSFENTLTNVNKEYGHRGIVLVDTQMLVLVPHLPGYAIVTVQDPITNKDIPLKTWFSVDYDIADGTVMFINLTSSQGVSEYYPGGYIASHDEENQTVVLQLVKLVYQANANSGS